MREKYIEKKFKQISTKNKRYLWKYSLFTMLVRGTGLEPVRIAALVPETNVSANSTSHAYSLVKMSSLPMKIFKNENN